MIPYGAPPGMNFQSCLPLVLFIPYCQRSLLHCAVTHCMEVLRNPQYCTIPQQQTAVLSLELCTTTTNLLVVCLQIQSSMVSCQKTRLILYTYFGLSSFNCAGRSASYNSHAAVWIDSSGKEGKKNYVLFGLSHSMMIVCLSQVGKDFSFLDNHTQCAILLLASCVK